MPLLPSYPFVEGECRQDLYHKDFWKNALKLAERRDEILSENPDMPVADALNIAYKELMEKEECKS